MTKLKWFVILVLALIFRIYAFRDDNIKLALLSELKQQYKTEKGQNFNRLDCSSFARQLYKKVGIDLPRDSRSQYMYTKHITSKDVEPGCLIFFKGSNKNDNRIGHVGVVSRMMSDTIFFIHMTQTRGLVEDHQYQKYYADRLVGYSDPFEEGN